MRRHPFRVTRLGAVLTIAVGLLTPMAANMVGAQAGLPVVIAQETPVVTVSPVRPRGFHPPSSGVRPNPERIARQAAIEVRWTNVLVHVRGTTAAYARRGRTHRRWAWCRAARSTSGSRSWPGSRRSRTTVDGGGWSFPTRGRGAGLDPTRRALPRTTRVRVEVDLSRHLIAVRKLDRVLFRAPGATGSPSSPTPVGEYFVTDRVAFSRGSSWARSRSGSAGSSRGSPRDGRAATSSRSMGRTTPRRSVGAPARDACGSPRRRSLGCCHSFATARR